MSKQLRNTIEEGILSEDELKKIDEFLDAAVVQIIMTIYRDKSSSTGWRYKTTFQFMSNNPSIPMQIGLPQQLELFSTTQHGALNKGARLLSTIAKRYALAQDLL
jgi:hypothetical protein